ncbi:MAG TPA: hypothetical protein VFJ82_15040 [Longimicrobium sp.]|nr:hypothetical protein [Longimicrobium sp.]
MRRAAAGAVLVALASVFRPGSAAAQRVEVDWVQAPNGHVILNATLLEQGKPRQVAALRIERYPGRVPDGQGLHPERGRFYASDASAEFRRVLARGADTMLARFAKEATTDPTRRSNEPLGVGTPHPLNRTEWDSLLVHLLNRRTIGAGDGRVEVREVPALVRDSARNQFASLFADSTASLLPRGSVRAADGRREIPVTFGSVPVSGDTGTNASASRHFTLRNYGARIASITLRFDSVQSGFRWKGGSTFILSPGDTAGVDVVFTPSLKGPHEAWARVVPDSLGALAVRMTGLGRSRTIPGWLLAVLKVLGGLILAGIVLSALLRTGAGRRLRDRVRPRPPVLIRESPPQKIPPQKIPAQETPPKEIMPEGIPAKEIPPQEIPLEEARVREATDRIRGLLPLLEEVNRDLEGTRALRADHRALVAGLIRLFPGIPEGPAETSNERLLAHVESTTAARGRLAEALRQAFPDVAGDGDLADGIIAHVNRDLEATRTLRTDHRALVAELTRLFPGIPEEPAETNNERLLAHVGATTAAAGQLVEALRGAFPDVVGDGNLADGIIAHVDELGRREAAGIARIAELERDLAERDRRLNDLTSRHKTLETTLRERDESLSAQVERSRAFEKDLQSTQDSLAAVQKARAEVEARVADLSNRYTEAEAKRVSFARLLQLPDAAPYAELQDRLTRLTPTLRPAYLLSFVQLLTDLERLFTTVCNQARDEPLRLAAQGILRGDRGNGGLHALRNDLEDPDRLLRVLQLQNPADLWDLPWRRFHEKVVVGGFMQILNNIARLGLYAGIRHPYVDVAQVLENSGVDPRLLDRAYGMVALRLESDYRMVLRTASLFHDQFHSGTHVRADYTVIERILPFVANPIGRLDSGVIYDLESVGYSVDGIEVKPPSVMAK